ncbi:AAA family ATPase [uncultured Clostridium sp.]|uniref:AAA family ATPase n=1 Tax=uncultured Clostridium sp. TaxID=59620 RepID=UPI002629668B|nr:AAA family ATPase [uncultured Clostridium sp.]
MELLLKSFAKVKYARIKCDGITVIAGENNTGKSTIGKTLFSLYNSSLNLSDKINNERKQEIKKILEMYMIRYINSLDISIERISIMSVRKNVNDILEEISLLGEEIEKDKILKLIEDYMIKYYGKNSEDRDNEKLEDISNKIINIINLPDKKIELEVMTRYFQNIFSNEINNVADDKLPAQIELMIKNKKMNLSFLENRCNNFEAQYNILNNAFYIDNPFILDDLNQINNWRFPSNRLKAHIISALSIEKQDLMDGVINTVSAQEKLKEIYRILEKVVAGEITKNVNGDYYFYSKKLNNQVQIKINNLSTGLKSFILIKMLLEKGKLKERDVLILDEPEIHLHPQWQIYYAELIVLLQKEFDLTITITTHSPYFIDAIEVFSAKYKIADKVNYYLSDTLDDYSVEVKDVSDNIELIYQKLADPLQKLENLRNGIINNV